MAKLEERTIAKLDEPMKRVEVFEVKNWIHFINQNVMSVMRFYSGPVKFTLGWLDRVDKTISLHLTTKVMLMKRGMATSSIYMKTDDKGIGLKSCVGVYLLELVRILQYKWEPYFGVNGSGGWRR